MSVKNSRSLTAQLKTRGPFRARDGLIFGVTKGLARYYGASTTLLRLILVAVSILLCFWPTVILYLAAALIMGPEPETGLESAEEREVWLQTQLDPDDALTLLSRRGEKIERRLRRLEDYVTSREYSWQARLKKGKP